MPDVSGADPLGATLGSLGGGMGGTAAPHHLIPVTGAARTAAVRYE